jgi:hypothetical protein
LLTEPRIRAFMRVRTILHFRAVLAQQQHEPRPAR